MKRRIALYGSIAEVTSVPSLWARLCGRRTSSRFAVRTRMGQWLWDREGVRVPDAIAGLLDAVHAQEIG